MTTRLFRPSLRFGFAALFAGLLVLGLIGQGEEVIAVEIGEHNTHLLPQGKEADGIVGDIVLQNANVVVLVSGNQPHRRANMSTEYNGETPGCLYDFDVRGAGNDQITVLRPGGQIGPLSWVRVVSDGSDGGPARVEAVRTAAKGDGLYTRHEYRLDRGASHLTITSTYRNESGEAMEIRPRPIWKGFSEEWTAGTVRVGDSIDPFDKRAYAWMPVSGEEMEGFAELAAGEERSYEVVVAVADSPAAAYGMAAARLQPSGTVTGVVKSKTGEPAVHAALLTPVAGEMLPGYPDAAGRFEIPLPVGVYKLRFEDLGRDSFEREVSVTNNQTARLDLELEPASTLRLIVNDAQGGPSPCKVQVIGVDGAETPDFGTHYRAYGNDHQYQSHDGRFTQQTPPGKYLVRITRGPEYELVERRVELHPGETVTVEASLERTVDTSGWIAADFHAHSTPSGDNYCKTDDRIINFAAEHLEFVPTTEHNRLYDWAPHIKRLGLEEQLKTVVGIELTGRGQHFNSFPLQVVPFAQDGGAPRWQFDPRINAVVLRDLFEGGPERWVQANHPIVGSVFNDRNGDGVFDGGFRGLEELVDAAEVWSTEILNPNPFYEREYNGKTTTRENRTFAWLQMLNQGRHVWCVAVSDAHRIFGNGAGSWRTYVSSSTDKPAEIDHKEIIRNAKAGRMMVTNGPFLEVTTADGLPIGSSVISVGTMDLNVKVQAPAWMEIDRVQILANGRQRPQDNYTRNSHPAMFRKGVVRFEETLTVKMQEDTHLIVVATGEGGTLEKGWGRSWESGMHPLAYTNPIYVDVDGKGFEANGDPLDHPLVTAGASD